MIKRSKLYGMITMGNENEITVTCKSGNAIINDINTNLIFITTTNNKILML